LLRADEVAKIIEDMYAGEITVTEDTELLDSGILDSLGMIELLERLEDKGYTVQPTRAEKQDFSDPARIAELANRQNENGFN